MRPDESSFWNIHIYQNLKICNRPLPPRAGAGDFPPWLGTSVVSFRFVFRFRRDNALAQLVIGVAPSPSTQAGAQPGTILRSGVAFANS
jgi:hypothetical protein